MSTEEKTAGKRLNWGDCPGVARDPKRLAGAWTFGNTRLPLHAVFENLAGGATIQEITRQFSVTEEQIKTVLAHTARMLEEDRLPRTTTSRPPTAWAGRPCGTGTVSTRQPQLL